VIIKKITQGYVIQEFDTELEEWVSSNFVAGDQVSYEDEEGHPVSNGTKGYLGFGMIQPETC
jgi:hypothetical protein